MKEKRRTLFKIEPVTAVRTTRNQKWLLKVDYETAKRYDNKKFALTGKKGSNAAFKKQMERYNAFKIEMAATALKMGFTMPTGYFAIWFDVPMPDTWRKWQIEANLGKEKVTAPDIDNYIKAVMDALMPRKNKRGGEKGSDDRKVHCFAAFKIWVRRGSECIRIIEYEQDDFMKVFSTTM